MDFTLGGVRPFGPHQIGDRITAPELVEATLASDQASSVVAITPSSAASMINTEH